MRGVLNNPWIVGALCVVALAMVLWRLTEKPAYEILPEDAPLPVQSLPPVVESPPTPEPVVASPTPPPSPTPLQLVTRLAGDWADAVSRDPFRPPGMVDDEENHDRGSAGATTHVNTDVPLHLQAVSLQGPQRLAVINHAVLSVGEHISGSQIVRIDAAGVLVKSNNGKYFIGFEEGVSQMERVANDNLRQIPPGQLNDS